MGGEIMWRIKEIGKWGFVDYKVVKYVIWNEMHFKIQINNKKSHPRRRIHINPWKWWNNA